MLLWGVVPLGFGRKIKKSVTKAMMMPAMIRNIRGLEKAGLFSGGGVCVSIGSWMRKKGDTCVLFSSRGQDPFLQGVLQERAARSWFFLVRSW